MMGKRIIAALLFLLPIALFAQSKTGRIAHIGHVVTAINTDTTLKKLVITKDNLARFDDTGSEVPDGGEDVTGYFKGGALVKIVHEVDLSTGMLTFEYYLEHGQVLFVYQREDKYPYMEKMEKLNYNVVTTASEAKYYLISGKVIKVIKTGASPHDGYDPIISLRTNVLKYKKWLLKRFKK